MEDERDIERREKPDRGNSAFREMAGETSSSQSAQTIRAMQEISRAKSSDPFAKTEKVDGPCICRECGDHFTGKHWKIIGRLIHQTNLCPPCEALLDAQARVKQAEEAERERQAWISDSAKFLPRLTRQSTFDNFTVGRNKKTMTAVREWADSFQGGEHTSMILYSRTFGCGKTHLACAAVNSILQRWPARSHLFHFVSGPQLLDRIKDTYRPNSGESKRQILHELSWVPLLVLDDVGKEKPSEHTREVYYEIIEDRMSSGRPVFITSNLPLESENGDDLEKLMGGAAISRLIGMCAGNYFELVDRDRRREVMGR